MEIKKVEINWMKNYGNLPHLEVTVNKMPPAGRYDHVTHGHGATSYWTETEGFVRFFTHEPSNQHGYGGSLFKGELLDGTPFNVKGPWSSNSLEMNKFFPASVEATIIETDGPLPSLRYAGHLLISSVLRLIPTTAWVTFVSNWGNDSQVSPKLDDDLYNLCYFETHPVIGPYGMTFMLNGCKTLAESQERKHLL